MTQIIIHPSVLGMSWSNAALIFGYNLSENVAYHCALIINQSSPSAKSSDGG